MLPPPHDEALRLGDDADQALAAGEIEHAEKLYACAAELEAKALLAVPRGKKRTIAILGLSVASLWYRASQYAEAERVARQLLDGDDLLPSTRTQLDELLEALPQAVSVASGGAILSLRPPDAPRSPPLRVVEQLRQLQTDSEREMAFEETYLANRTLLLRLAVNKFRIPDSDAEALVQEVFAAFTESDVHKRSVRGWLVAAVCNASRHYWRLQSRMEALPPDYAEFSDPVSRSAEDQIVTRLTVRQALNYLQPRCREAILLHYFEGYSSSEIARRMQTTPRYAEKLIHNCLKRVREIYISIVRAT